MHSPFKKIHSKKLCLKFLVVKTIWPIHQKVRVAFFSFEFLMERWTLLSTAACSTAVWVMCMWYNVQDLHNGITPCFFWYFGNIRRFMQFSVWKVKLSCCNRHGGGVQISLCTYFPITSWWLLYRVFLFFHFNHSFMKRDSVVRELTFIRPHEDLQRVENICMDQLFLFLLADIRCDSTCRIAHFCLSVCQWFWW